jgi:hypothetical protein
MRKILISLVAGAALTAAPALATKPQHPDHPAKPAKPATPSKCKTHKVGYNAKGTLVSQALTQTKGTATPTDKSDDRYSGDVTVNVTKANHKAPKGVQTVTLTDAKVSWYDANKDGAADVPAAGDTVGIHGKITKLSAKCDQTGFTPTVTVKKLSFKQAKPAPTTPTP